MIVICECGTLSDDLDYWGKGYDELKCSKCGADLLKQYPELKKREPLEENPVFRITKEEA